MVNAGLLLREWRAVRRMSQLALALEADVSTRYLSCVETGKSQPSREFIMKIAAALSMPLRERNTLMLAVGYAPSYPETELRNTGMTQIQRAIDLILEHQEPYPAFVLNRCWDIVQTNRAAERMAEFLIGGTSHTNMAHQFFDPKDMRRAVSNWEEVAGDMIQHLHDALSAAPFDTEIRDLLEEVLNYPGVPSKWHRRELTVTPSPILTVEFCKDGQTLRFFSTFTTFGTPRDITIEELKIECTFPADEATAQQCRVLAEVA
jgi:transcriptional regulator with XRE-family HTH domain